MSFMHWEDRYRLGVPEMDADHKTLIDLLSRVMEAGNDDAEMARRLAAFVDECRAHFGREERLLDRIDYPDLAGHRAEHGVLFSQVRNFEQRLAAGEIDRTLMEEVGEYLRHWLLDHIQRDDRAYAPYLQRLS